MNKRIGRYLYLSSLFLALILATTCTSTVDTESTPITLPTAPPPQEPRALSASELMAVDGFVTQEQAIGVEWDQFHIDFDKWRATLTSCGESTVQNALREFVVSFNSATEQARDLPRATTTREFAETLIEAAESEEAAFRQLHERWQPNSPSIFEVIDQKRTEAARAQREVQDLVMDLQEELDEATDPERLQAIEEFSLALKPVSDAWDELHDEYTKLLQGTASLDNLTVLGRLDGLIEQLNSILDSIAGLPTTDATEDMVEALQEAAEAEQTALANTHNAVIQEVTADSEKGDEPATPGTEDFEERVAPLHDALEQAIKDSRTALKEVELTIENALDGSAEEDLQDLQEFADKFEIVLPAWAAFHEQYNDWRRTEGGCNRAEVLQALGQFNLRMTEISRQVRDLPQSGYLLPMYNLLVEAAERERGTIRALRNSWRPFTVDAFIAAERERDNADRLRREASIALEELLSRS